MGNDDAEELESLGLDVAGGSLDTRRGPRFGCTPAMEAWVEHVLDGCTDGEAARLAGYAGKDEKAFAIRGSKLRHHSRVKVLLETRKLERAGIVSPKILSAERGLELLSKIAEEGKNEQARISAVKALRDIEREASAPTLNRAGFDKLVADGWLTEKAIAWGKSHFAEGADDDVRQLRADAAARHQDKIESVIREAGADAAVA